MERDQQAVLGWTDRRAPSSFSAIQVQRDVIIFENTRFAYHVQRQVCDPVIFVLELTLDGVFRAIVEGQQKTVLDWNLCTW